MEKSLSNELEVEFSDKLSLLEESKKSVNIKMSVAAAGAPAWASKTRNIVCIGKNFDKHIKELAHLNPTEESKALQGALWKDKRPKDPMVFLKPYGSLMFDGPITLPK